MDAEVVEEEHFGPYLVYERLGVGGMATVHRARERGIEGFERMVALKRLLPHLAEDASFIKSFVREAKLASLLNHVNIVQIFELGRVGAQYFISMEYIEGRDVRRVLRHARKVTGPPAIHATVGILIQLCEALDYAHTKSDASGQPLHLVHRDISPSNLLITRAGHLKVIDFGIARAQSSQLRTQTGRVKGKLAYMAPEAISGKDLDARSDLWAVGVIAHELLTARPLFASKNEYETLLKVQRGDLLAPSTFNQACPPELDAVVARALARDPDQRYASAAELRDDLNNVRRMYGLETNHRDVAGWLDWAFSVEAPTGGFAGNTLERSGSGSMAFQAQQARTPTPAAVRAAAVGRITPPPQQAATGASLAQRRDEDAAVEIAWGGAEPEDNAGPLLLDDIPDVSGKHLAAGSVDDIPASLPTHGQHRGTGPITGPLTGPIVAARERTGPLPNRESVPSLVHARPTPSPGSTAEVLAAHGDAATGAVPRVPTFGSAIVAQGQSNKKKMLVLGGVLVAAAAVTVIVLATRGGSSGGTAAATLPVPAAKTTGMLKFNVQPVDSTISVGIQDAETKHKGSPWSVELPVGPHSVTIEHEGFKPYLVAVDLEPDEKTVLRVVLEPLDANPTGDATLIVSSNPDGLDVFIDGKATGQKTPLRAPLPAGAHVVTLRKNGDEVWHYSLVAKPNTMSELNATIPKPVVAANTPAKTGESKPAIAAADKAAKDKADKADHEMLPSVATNEVKPEPKVDAPKTEPKPEPAKTEPKPEPAKTEPKPEPAKIEPKVEAPVVVTPPKVTTPPPAGPPAMIPPNKVSKVSGDAPHLSNAARASVLPATIIAKLCIDTSGRVTSATMITKLEQAAASEIGDAMRGWRYTAYSNNGVPTPACFAVTMKTK